MTAEIHQGVVTHYRPQVASMRPRSNDRGNEAAGVPPTQVIDLASMRPRSNDRGNTGGTLHVNRIPGLLQ